MQSSFCNLKSIVWVESSLDVTFSKSSSEVGGISVSATLTKLDRRSYAASVTGTRWMGVSSCSRVGTVTLISDKFSVGDCACGGYSTSIELILVLFLIMKINV